MFLYIIIGLAVLITATTVIKRLNHKRHLRNNRAYWHRRRQQEEADLQEWIELAESGDEEARQKIFERFNKWIRSVRDQPESENARLNALLVQERKRIKQQEFDEWFLPHNREIHETDDADKKTWRYLDLVRYLERSPLAEYAKDRHGVTFESIREEFRQHIRKTYKELLSAATESLPSLIALKALIEETRKKPSAYDKNIANYLSEPLPTPENWAQLVIHHFDNPPLDMFIDEPESIGSGRLRLRAAKALQDDDEFEALAVLAYCNANYRRLASFWRDEVGHVLTAELAKMVTTMREQRQAESQI